MAENPLDEILQSDEPAEGGSSSEREPISTAAYASAVAAQEASRDPAVAEATTRYLKRQAGLLALQTRQLKEQHPLQLADLRLKLLTQQLRIVLQAGVLIGATCIIAALLALLWGATSARSVVITAFETSGIPAQGLTGTVVAGRFLDTLVQMQAATRGRLPKRSLEDAWSNDIKLEVPETGISIGDAERFLKEQFGHETRISGSLLQTSGGVLELTVTGDGLVPHTFTSSTGNLEELTTAAAEYVYRCLQPSSYFRYLIDVGRSPEVVEEAPGALPTAEFSDKPHIFNEWANALENTSEAKASAQTNSRQLFGKALELYKEAVRLKPDYWDARSNIVNAEVLLGNEEGAWRAADELRRLRVANEDSGPDTDWEYSDMLTWNLDRAHRARLKDTGRNAGLGTDTVSGYVDLALLDILLHDPATAQVNLDIAASEAHAPDAPQAAATDGVFVAMSHFVSAQIDAARGHPADLAAAASEMEEFRDLYRAQGYVASNYPTQICWLAPAEEAAGHRALADAAIAAAPPLVDCLRFHADILDGRGQWAEARAIYEVAVRQAPDLPAAYYSYGLALARHGETARAIEMFSLANARGPHWAEPLKAWGDTLGAEGRTVEAIQKYKAAAQLAPAWLALQNALRTAGGGSPSM